MDLISPAGFLAACAVIITVVGFFYALVDTDAAQEKVYRDLKKNQ